jgi:hypothetical protein
MRIIIVIIIFTILLSVWVSQGYESISQNEANILSDFANRFLTSYRSYVSFNLPEEIQNYKNEKGDYAFFPFKQEILDIKIFYTHGDLVALLFIPTEKNSVEIIDYEKSELSLFGISWGVNGTYHLVKECNNLIETDIVAYKSPCVYFFSKSQMKNPSYAKEIALEYVNWENQTVHKTIETKKINEIWKPFKSKNNEIILNNRNLLQAEDEIDDKISWDEKYTYNLFLINFYKFNLSVTHYKEFPIMADKWNEFANSDLIKNFNLSSNPEINSSFWAIRNNIATNENYTNANLDEDLPRLNNSINSIQSELQNNSIKSRLSNLYNHFQSYFLAIFIGILTVLGSFLILRQVINERIQIKNEITNSFKVLYVGLNKLIESILLQVKQKIKRHKKEEKH